MGPCFVQVEAGARNATSIIFIVIEVFVGGGSRLRTISTGLCHHLVGLLRVFMEYLLGLLSCHLLIQGFHRYLVRSPLDLVSEWDSRKSTKTHTRSGNAAYFLLPAIFAYVAWLFLSNF